MRPRVEVLRLNFKPSRVTAGSEPLRERKDTAEAGYTLQPLPGGDWIVRVRHVDFRRRGSARLTPLESSQGNGRARRDGAGGTPGVSQQIVGRCASGEEIVECRLTNSRGTEAAILTLGATLRTCLVARCARRMGRCRARLRHGRGVFERQRVLRRDGGPIRQPNRERSIQHR